MKQFLTPAPDVRSINWKQSALAAGKHRHTDLKSEANIECVVLTRRRFLDFIHVRMDNFLYDILKCYRHFHFSVPKAIARQQVCRGDNRLKPASLDTFLGDHEEQLELSGANRRLLGSFSMFAERGLNCPRTSEARGLIDFYILCQLQRKPQGHVLPRLIIGGSRVRAELCEELSRVMVDMECPLLRAEQTQLGRRSVTVCDNPQRTSS